MSSVLDLPPQTQHSSTADIFDALKEKKHVMNCNDIYNIDENSKDELLMTKEKEAFFIMENCSPRTYCF